MSQLELFIKPVQKKIINNIEYGEVKLEDIMPNIAPNQYILYPTGGYHYFCNIKNAPEKYKKPIWPYLSSTTKNKTIIVSILPNIQFGGYPTATLKWKDGFKNNNTVATPQVMHRIVSLAYVPNPDPITHIHVAHKHDEKCNYLPEHLEWTTPSDNHTGRKARRSSYEQFYDFFLAQKWVQE
jgi:hypothetical protein